MEEKREENWTLTFDSGNMTYSDSRREDIRLA